MNNLIFLFIFVPILAIVLLALNFLLSTHRPDESKVSPALCLGKTLSLSGKVGKNYQNPGKP